MKYVILSRPRCGTYMLGSMLGDCAGEWFHEDVQRSALELALSTYNPFKLFNGVVVHYRHVPQALQVLQQPYKVIHLTRECEVERLLSLVIAQYTGVWHGEHKQQIVVALPALVDVIQREQQHEMCNTLPIDLEVSYESLLSGNGLYRVCKLLNRSLEDIQAPACKRSPHYRDVIINWQDCEAYLKDVLQC